MKFNINNYVRVQLTDQGKEILRQQFLKNHNRYPKVFHTFRLPEEDSDGWSTWQLWKLMSTFGEYIGLGKEPPFETEIEIKNP